VGHRAGGFEVTLCFWGCVVISWDEAVGLVRGSVNLHSLFELGCGRPYCLFVLTQLMRRTNTGQMMCPAIDLNQNNEVDKLGIQLNEETAKERQSRVARAGGDWENYVQLYLSDKLQGTNIKMVKGSDIPKNSILWKKISIPTKVSTVEETVWGDIDLVALKNSFPIAVISCKLSLHGRFTETLFYSLLFRMLTRTKFVLATPDAGRGQSGKWASEWGNPEEPTKDRILAESYLDAVYVENVEEFCKFKKPDEGTATGGIVRSLSELPSDLIKWSEEISRFVYSRRRLNNFK